MIFSVLYSSLGPLATNIMQHENNSNYYNGRRRLHNGAIRWRAALLMIAIGLACMPVSGQPGAADLYIYHIDWDFNALVSPKTGVVVKGRYQMPNGRWRRFSPQYGRSGQHELKIDGHPASAQYYCVKIQGEKWEYHLPPLSFETDYYLTNPAGVFEAEYEVLEVPGGGGLQVHHPGRRNGFLRVKGE